MTGWTPLFQQIIGSSIWGAENHIRIAWITMLAVANKDGIAPVTAGGLARLANISREEAAEALEALSSPDDDTLTQEFEGRRIERCDTGWRLLNFVKYRDMAKKAIIREQNRTAQAEWRASQDDPDNENPNPPEPTNPKPPPHVTEATIPPALNTPAFLAIWKTWLDHLKQKRKTPTTHAVELQLRKLADMGLVRAIAAVENSISKNYQGVYEENSNNNPGVPHGTTKPVNVDSKLLQEHLSSPSL